jgi:hypothetical protein
MKLFNKILLPLLILFVLMNIFIFTAQSLWQKFDVDTNVLIAANILFLTLAIVVFLIQKNALKNPNPNAFIRSIIGGTMIKMFGTVIAVLVYVLQAGKGYSKNAVFVALLTYLIYLAVEVICMSKIVRNNK